MRGTLCVFYRAVGAAHVRPGGAQWADAAGKLRAGHARPYGAAMITPPRKSLYADLAGKDAGVAGLVADDETALVVHVNGGSGAAVVGDAAAQIRRQSAL